MKSRFLDSGGGGSKKKNKKDNSLAEQAIKSPTENIETDGEVLTKRTLPTSKPTGPIENPIVVTDCSNNSTSQSTIPTGKPNTRTSGLNNLTGSNVHAPIATASPNSTLPFQSGDPKLINTRPISYINIVNSEPTYPKKNGGEQVGEELVNGNKINDETPSSYATKLKPTSSTKANLRKLEANVPNDADYEVRLTLASVHEVNDRMKNSLNAYFIGKRLAFPEGVDSVLRDGPWMIREIPLFLNKWSPFVSLLKEELSRVPILVKFHDVSLVAYTSNGLSLIATKIETIHIEYEWEPPRCCTCLIFGHLLDDCPKAPKRVVNRMDKGKGQTSGDDDEGFIEVRRKKLGGNNGGNKTFKSGLVKPKTLYRPKVKQSAEGTSNSQKTTPFVGMNKASTSCYNKYCTKSPSNKGNGFSDDTDLFSLSNSFEALNVENPFIDEVATSIKGKLVLVDDDGKPLKKVDYSGNTDSVDEVEHDDNEIASYLASIPIEVRYVPKSLLDQWRDTVVDDDYDLYDDDMYEG
ncbi:putative ribonuclease H-like domain-containing protein [Tanacetum coccineum]